MQSYYVHTTALKGQTTNYCAMMILQEHKALKSPLSAVANMAGKVSGLLQTLIRKFSTL